MKIGMIGAGNMGASMGTAWAAKGHTVCFSAVFRSMPTEQLQLGADDPLLRPIRDELVAQEVGIDPFRHSGRRRCSKGVDVLFSRGVFAAQQPPDDCVVS